MTGMFQIWAESEANTMRQLVLIVSTREVDILPPMSTCLEFKPEQSELNNYLVIIHFILYIPHETIMKQFSSLLTFMNCKNNRSAFTHKVIIKNVTIS